MEVAGHNVHQYVVNAHVITLYSLGEATMTIVLQ